MLRTTIAMLLCVLLLGGCTGAVRPGTGVQAGRVLYTEDFKQGLTNWVAELERGGTVAARDGVMDVDVPGGCTVWFRPRLEGPVVIEYDATVVVAGGPNDRGSDLNCFWMATDTRSPDDIFGYRRSGKFADYNRLRCYYVGLGGNSNTTTRFRRYVGDPVMRPLLPGDDLGDPAFLIRPNVRQHIRLVADGRRIEYWRDGRRIFALDDPQPYTSGWFAIRTTQSHVRVEHLRVSRPG